MFHEELTLIFLSKTLWTAPPHCAECWMGCWSTSLLVSAGHRLQRQGQSTFCQIPAPPQAETRLRPNSALLFDSGSGSCSGCVHWWLCFRPLVPQAVKADVRERMCQVKQEVKWSSCLISRLHCKKRIQYSKTPVYWLIVSYLTIYSEKL